MVAKREDALCPFRDFAPCSDECMLCIKIVFVDEDGMNQQIYCAINGILQELRELNANIAR